MHSSKRFACNHHIMFTYNLSNDEYLYLMVNRNYGNAPNRNIFKRRARSLFDKLTKKNPDKSIGLMIKPLQSNVSYSTLKYSFNLLENKINLESD